MCSCVDRRTEAITKTTSTTIKRRRKPTEYMYRVYKVSDGFVLQILLRIQQQQKKCTSAWIFYKTIAAKHGPKDDCTMSTCDFTIHICLIHCNKFTMCLCISMYVILKFVGRNYYLWTIFAHTHTPKIRTHKYKQFDFLVLLSFI